MFLKYYFYINLEQLLSLHTPQKNLLFTLIVPWSFGTYEILQFFPSKNAQIKERRSTSSYIFVSEANLQHPPVRPSVRRSQNLVRTTPPKRLDGLS